MTFVAGNQDQRGLGGGLPDMVDLLLVPDQPVKNIVEYPGEQPVAEIDNAKIIVGSNFSNVTGGFFMGFPQRQIILRRILGQILP